MKGHKNINTLTFEWKYTYLSARKEYNRRHSARLFLRELWKGWQEDLGLRNRNVN